MKIRTLYSQNGIISSNVIFNKIDISGTLDVKNKTTLADLSANDASFNNVDIDTNLLVKGKLTLIGDLTANNIYNKTQLDSNFSAIDVSFNDIYNIKQDKITKTTDISMGNLIVNGNLEVNKINYETQNINTTYSNTIINDNIITLGLDASNNELSYDTGFIFTNNKTDVSNVALYWDSDDNAFVLAKTDSSGVAFHNDSLKVNRGELSNLYIKDLSANDVSFNNIQFFGKLLDPSGLNFQSGSGSGIDIRGNTTDISKNDPSLNDLELGLSDKDRSEGEIIYDSSKNIFYEASRSKTDISGNGVLAFRQLGYSFFRDNMEGQPPAPSFFFFLITPSSIKISWTNPHQYVSGVTNPNDPYNHGVSGEFSSTVNASDNIYFPVVNRIMIQIKNKQTGNYEQWGEKRSPVSQNISDINGGYVICAKNHPVPPISNSTLSPSGAQSFGTTLSSARSGAVYKLKDFANSIILYKLNGTPGNDKIITNITNDSKLVSAVKDEPNKELNTSSAGYEIKLWLENGYNSGSMSENDFNTITLTKDNDGNNINFLEVDPPTAPLDLSANIVFNDLGTTENGNTIVELIVKDPSMTTITDSTYNTGSDTINLVGVKIEYANTSTNDPSGHWTDVSNIYFSETQLTKTELSQTGKDAGYFSTDGIHTINRLNHVQAGQTDTNTLNYYYIKLNSSFLDVSNNDMKQYHTFRASYKNASKPVYGVTKQSNIISIKKPFQPTISSVKMTSYNKFTITLVKFGDKEDIISDATGIANTDMGVFLRNINFNVAYQYGNDSSNNITTFEGIQGASSSTSTNSSVFVNTTSFSDSTYTYTIPAGLIDSNKTTSLTYYFSVSVQNNIIGAYSDYSNLSSIVITEPNSSIAITLTPQTSGSNYNNKISATWTAPSNGNRGIVNAQANTGLPTLNRYTLNSTNLKNVNNDTAVTYTNDINSSNRDTDPNRDKMLTFYDSLKGTTGSTTKNLDLTIREYNEYINDYTEVSKNVSATATKPQTISINGETNLVISKDQNKSQVTLNWSHPTNRGLTIDGTNISNTILMYTIDIERSSTTNKYLDGNSSHTDAVYDTSTNQSDSTNDKIGITDAVKLKTINSSNDSSLLWPNSTYEYTIKATNSLGYTSDMQSPKKSFTTGTPEIPSVFGYFTNDRLGNLTSGGITTDLIGNNSYTNLGVLKTTNISSSTTYSGTAVQITNYNDLIDITSNTFTHVLNKTNIQTFKTNSQVQTWSSSVPTSANQAGFKIVNAADSNALVYSRGMSTNHLNETNDSALFEVFRTDRKDIYAQTYDDRNRGYWFQEIAQYKLNLAAESNLNDYRYKPLKFVLQSHYNENGGDATISANATGQITILQNTASSNGGNVYLDVISSLPSLNTTPTLVYTINNYINGVPNLAPLAGTYNKLKLSYTLNGYSSRYLLISSTDFISYTFSNTNANGTLGNKKWSDFGSSAPSVVFTRNNTNWTIANHEFNITSTCSTSRTDIQVTINATNTKGTAGLPINTGTYKFIYDINSVNEFNSIKNSLEEIPSNFNPKYPESSAQTQYNSTAYSAVGNNINTKQLTLWNRYFYGSEGWRSATSITTSNCSNYGMANNLPVFDTGNVYKWVIFKYQGSGNPTSAYTYYTVIAKFSDSDFDYDNNVVGEDIVVYFYNRGEQTQGNDGNNYYWLNISGKSDYGKSDASQGGINTYSGTVGISTQNANSSNFESSSYSKLGTNGERILGAWLNSSSIPAGVTATFYLAVGIKNTETPLQSGQNHVKIRKPQITLAQESVVRQNLS